MSHIKRHELALYSWYIRAQGFGSRGPSFPFCNEYKDRDHAGESEKERSANKHEDKRRKDVRV